MQNQPVEKAYKITCPACKTKQTAFIKFSDGFVTLMAENDVGYNLTEGTPYILCVNRWNCQHMMTGNELDEAIRPMVSFPRDWRTALK